MSFPTTIDTLTTHSDGQFITAADINADQTAIVAIETKVGIDASAVTTTLDYLVRYDDLPISWTANGDQYYVASRTITFSGPAQVAGTGTITYATALAATPTTFGAASLPVTLAPGDVLKVTCAALSVFKAIILTGRH